MRNPTMAELELINLFNIVFRKYAEKMAKKQCCLAHAMMALYEVDFIDQTVNKLEVALLMGHVSTETFTKQMTMLIDSLNKQVEPQSTAPVKITQLQTKVALA